MIPRKTQSISFLELIFTAIVLTSSLVFIEKYWLNSSFSTLPTVNLQLEQVTQK